MIKKGHVPFLLLLLVLSQSTRGAIRSRSIEEQARLASAIALGHVENTSAFEDDEGRIYTDVAIRGHIVTPLGIKEQITEVRVPGGVTETRGLFVSTSPVFRTGETVLVFLQSRANRPYSVLDGRRGKLTIAGDRILERGSTIAEVRDQVLSALTTLQSDQVVVLEDAFSKIIDDRRAAKSDLNADRQQVPMEEGPCYEYTGLRWQEPTAHLKYDGSIPSEWRPAIAAAFTEWNEAGSSFRFVLDDQTTNYLQIGEIEEEGVIAFAELYYAVPSGFISSARLVFNSSYSWSWTGEPGMVDVQSIAAHELGHWLHLADLYRPECSDVTMFGIYTLGDTGNRTLADADITGILLIYGLSIRPPARLRISAYLHGEGVHRDAEEE